MSQSARILEVLGDGQPHLVSEIHARAGYSRLNSRVAELRKRGYAIESYHVGGKTGSEGYGYRLLSSGPQAITPSPAPTAEQPSSSVTACRSAVSFPSAAAQLSLETAAC